ncbi:hypothetical protein HYPSUDRAFT_62339 [Hypholoma sublateritium FD-334 SS-4]|uniref:Uncharacterized protein n=1 Tax=Hypholoma sublateritium (strain FD-334 SS-4) TaxID=945553 RepID=A0A0D2MVB1_HYPSF|nr:hypothetical protein HYPSUDRAFT_62339 [Hypholoma sublateritium FD-334 SS-4]
MNNPLIDDKNPFYCPAIPAATYLKSLRSRTRNLARSSQYFPSASRSFTNVLEESLLDAQAEKFEDNMGSDWILGDYFTSGRGWFLSPLDELPPYSPTESAKTQTRLQALGFCKEKNSLLPTAALRVDRHIGLKRKSPFSDFGAPPKYARSVQSLHESSFDIELQREQLRYSDVESSPGKNNDLLNSAEHSEANLIHLINRLDDALPGIRLKGRLWQYRYDTPQALMDFLGDHGYVNQASLEILCRSEIINIKFAPSMFEENGLNIYPREIYSVLGKEGNFHSLTEISFSGINIRDADIRHIHHLRSLSVLFLDDTGITNEAVFLLVSLKNTLCRLSIARNIDINEDAVPAILLLLNLSFLSILDTSIGIVGLRRLAESIHKYDRLMDIEIPFVCEEYIDNIQKKYLFNPVGPLITNPDACEQLSYAALKRNLEAHAACNPTILASGTTREMAQRLFEILKIRRADILVVSMLTMSESSTSQSTSRALEGQI